MSPFGGVCKSAGRMIRNGRTSPAGGYKSFCVSLRFCPRLPRRQASDRRLVAGQPHGTLTLAGYSADRAFRLRKYHYPRCLSSRIHREQSDGRARTLDTIRRLELVTQSLACEGNSGNVSAEGVFGCQRTGHRCFLCRSYDQVQMKTHDLNIIPHPESLVKRFHEIFLYFFFALIY